MRQSGHWEGDASLEVDSFLKLMTEAIEQLDVEQAKADVLPFVREPSALDVWSQDFFRDIVKRVSFYDPS
jgi:Mlc titration factor MtfA (ptsG expression regulator)